MCAVEWKKLGDVCEVGTGSNNREDACDKGLYPFYVRSKDVLRINKYLFDEEAIIIPGEGGIGDIFHYANGKYGLHQRAYRVHPIDGEVVCKYLYYYLSDKFKQYIVSKSVGATATSIRKPMLEGFMLPIPSLAKQQEIVSHLDTFTTLISNLESELDMRRKQYEHYRNQLLDFEGVEDVEWKTLGEVCKIMNGKDYKSLSDGNVPVYGSGGIMAYVDTFAYNRPSVLLPRKGSLNNVFYVDEPFWTVDTIYWTIINEEIILPKYFYCYMAMQNLEKLNIAAGAVPSLTQSILNKINIPLPTIFNQQEIVEKLDTFEQLIQSFEQEIKLRKQQYEYYREKLLTFEKE